MGETKRAKFVNVDVELRSKRSLAKLGAHLRDVAFELSSEKFFVSLLSSEKFFVSFEVFRSKTTFDPGTPDATIRALVTIVEALPVELRDAWDRCESRFFDIGIEAGTRPPAGAFELSGETISLLGSVRGEIRITVYPPTAAD
jgi:hypothetical protein